MKAIKYYEDVFRQVIMDNHIVTKPITLQQALQNLIASECDAERDIQLAFNNIQQKLIVTNIEI